MRVLLTTDTLGGVWTFTKELSEGLLAAGHAVGLVSLGRMPSASQRAAVEEMKGRFGERFFSFASAAPLDWMDDNERVWRDGVRVVREAVARFEPDLIHANQICFGRLQVGVPVLVTAHSDVLSWSDACGGGGTGHTAGWLGRYQKLVRDGLAGADAVVAPTEWMAGALRRHYPEREDVGVVLNGRTLATRPGGKRALQAVTAGRLWDEAKGLGILGQVELPMPVFVAGELAVGDGVARVAPRSVTVVGELAERELHGLFGRSSLYVVTSVYEPFGLAPLEAALCGCAVVARDLASLREVWGEGAVYFSDAAGLEARLGEMAASPAALRAAQTKAMARARMLSGARMTAAYLAEYAMLLPQAGAVFTGERDAVHAA